MRRAVLIFFTFLFSDLSASAALSYPDSLFSDSVFHLNSARIEIVRSDYQWLGVADLWDTSVSTSTLFLVDRGNIPNAIQHYYQYNPEHNSIYVQEGLFPPGRRPKRSFNFSTDQYQWVYADYEVGGQSELMPPHLGNLKPGKYSVSPLNEKEYVVSFVDTSNLLRQTDFHLRFEPLSVPDSIVEIVSGRYSDSLFIEKERLRVGAEMKERMLGSNRTMTEYMERSPYQPVDFTNIHYVSLANELGFLFPDIATNDSPLVFISLRWELGHSRLWKVWSYFMEQHPEWKNRFYFLVVQEDMQKARNLLPEEYWNRAFMISNYEANRVALDRTAICVVDPAGRVILHTYSFKDLYPSLEQTLLK